MPKGKKAVSLRDTIMKRLHASTFLKPHRIWLHTGSKFLNAVLGSKKLGLPAGKMYHLAGKKHGGKSALITWLVGKCQRQKKAFVIWIDAENSFSPGWVTKQGLKIGKKEDDYNSDDFYLIQPKVLKRVTQRKSKRKGVKTEAKGSVFLQSCEFLFKEAEEVMAAIKEADPDRPIALALDSVANLQTEMVIELGLTEQNMRAGQDRAQFLSLALPKWVSLGRNYTVWMFLINQIRVNPMKMFGDPEYSPGGNALEHNCHVMALIRRKGGAETQDGKAKSISGYMKNIKNKAGGGSYEGGLCSYYVDLQAKDPDKMWKFGPIKKKKKEEAA